ncbi:MAG: acyl-CoA thioesterase, partial [Phycisphaerae bacterium]
MATGFTTTRTVTFAETDLAGVMHFSNFFRVMEEVEHAFWRSLGLKVVMPDGDAHISWPRKSVACEFHQPARFEDTLECHLRVTKVGERSVEYEIRFRCNDR